MIPRQISNSAPGWTIALSAAIFALMGAAPAAALDDAELYKVVAYVTGTVEPERSRGFREGLEQVFIKLTGDAGLAGAPGLEPYLAQAGSLVASFEYEDRMKGLPLHDEQGTRERPYFLRITFDRSKVDHALDATGARKWPATDRPRLAVFLAVRDARHSYVLTRADDNGYGQREVLKSAAARRGMPITLPAGEAPVSEGVIRSGARDALQTAASALAADCPLFGALDLDSAGTRWDMQWTLDCRGKVTSWTMKSVTFDAALSGGIERSAQILSSARH